MNTKPHIENTQTLAEAMNVIRLFISTDPAGLGQVVANRKITSLNDQILRLAVREFIDTRLPPRDGRVRWGNQQILACVHAAHADVIATRSQNVFTLTDDLYGNSTERAAVWKQEVHCIYNSLPHYHALLWYVLFIHYPALLHLEKNNPLGISDEMGLKRLSKKKDGFAADNPSFRKQKEMFSQWWVNFKTIEFFY